MSAGAASAGRILVVEDDPVTAAVVGHILGKRGGFEVCHTADPTDALARLASESWDLVLTDVEMPEMTGAELVKALRKISPDLPVAVITGHSPADSAMRELRSQVDELLEKPVAPDRLIATATELIARGRSARGRGRET